VLVVDAEAQVAAVVRRALVARGHEVLVSTSATEALELPAPDVIVLDVGHADGQAILARLRARGTRPRAVLTTTTSLGSHAGTVRFGADRLVVKPFRVEELVAAVEAADAPAERGASGREAAASPAADDEGPFRRALRARADEVDRVVRELVAWAVRLGAGPSARARLGSATAEVLENVVRHAYGADEGSIALEAELEGRALQVTVTDRGGGFDAVSALAACGAGPARTGLARVAALTEDLSVSSRPGAGARVVLRVHLHRATFEGVDSVDLSELDWLSPELARRVLAALEEGEDADLFQLSPALAVTVGRLLHGPDTRSVLQSALWS
jgi:anti-sigma regulatory factor (Ser/Thr protein kinase)/ActR/RegA family two-component response regulator